MPTTRVIPAKAGIQNDTLCRYLDSGLRRNDEVGLMRRMTGRRLALLALISIAQISLVPIAPVGQAAAEDERRAYVTVAGAPGDGETVLAAAVSRRLAKAGFRQATAFEASIYEVQGSVRLNPGPGSKQTVKIVWVVFDPGGTQLGVVAQEKIIRKGSLDKRWGKAADAAAQAAAADILGLLPRD